MIYAEQRPPSRGADLIKASPPEAAAEENPNPTERPLVTCGLEHPTDHAARERCRDIIPELFLELL